MAAIAKFSGYLAARIVHLGTFFERMESIISFEMLDFARVYKYVAFPIQVILPVVNGSQLK